MNVDSVAWFLMGAVCFWGFSLLVAFSIIVIHKLYSIRDITGKKKKMQRLSHSIKQVNHAEDRRRIKAMERMWVRDTPKIHALNYWFYRYLTNEFELYILDAIKFVEVDKEWIEKN